MIKIENLSYGFPKKDLFNNISFELEKGQHCAFIGTSGSGKSTLIDMIMNPNHYMFDGTIEKDPLCRIGYVSQFSKVSEAEDVTVFEYIAGDFLRLQKKITDICTQMESGENIETLLEDYQRALDELESLGGDDFESVIDKQLNLADLMKLRDLSVHKLSGGEFKLIQVIKEMLHSPEVMIMDEPDVFLDFDNLNSLKNLFNGHKGILFIITHNRYLLNHCFDKIIHLENMEINSFDGRYIDYNLFLLKTKIELQEQSIKDDEEIARNEVLIDRLRESATAHAEASKGRSLKARVKIQERLEATRTLAPFVDIKQPYIEFSNDNLLEEGIILEAKDYSLSFDDLLIENANFEIGAKDKVAIIGPNGTGKTSLLRDIFVKKDQAFIRHPEADIAYLSQIHGEVLDESNTIRQEFFDAKFTSLDHIRNYLLNYCIDPDTIDQTIGSLSGGEKNILQLAKISSAQPNLLLLDEPTSHLDTYSQISLERAIDNYEGAVVMVSHDYYTIVNCMDYVLLVEDNKIRRVRMRTFRKMIYKNYFDKDYLEIDAKKNVVERKIEQALKNKNFEQAKTVYASLEAIVDDFKKAPK